MSYGLYLYKETISVGGRTMRLEIWEKDYVGASAEIEAMGVPPFTISLDNSGGKIETPLIKTNATIVIKDTGQIDYDTLFTPDATKYKGIIKVAGADYWYGFLTPDSFSQALSYKSDIVLTARDNLGMLASFRYERAGARATMRTLLNEAMTLISFGNTLEYRQIKTSGATNILDGYIRADKYIGGTWADAVEEILHDCGLQMRFIGGAKYAVYDIGNIASLGTTLATQTFRFINKSGNKEIVPAVKDIKISQNYGSIENSYDGVMNAEDYDLRAVRAVVQPTNQYILQPETYNINYYDPSLGQTVWGGLAGTQGMINPNEWNELPSTIMITGDLYTLTTYRQPISYSQIMPVTQSNVEIRMKVSNLVKYPSVIDGKAIWKDLFFMFLADERTSIYWSGAHYRIKLRYNIFLVSATKTYVMREQWEEFTDTTPSVGTYLTFLLPSGGSDGGVPIFKDYNARDEEITFNIQTIPEDGVLQIAFYPYEIVGQFVQEYPSVVPQDIKNNIPLTYPILIKDITIKYPAAEIGGLDSQAIISANHNVSLDVNLNLGQVPSGVGDSATMQGGIYSNGANYYKALGNFFRTAGTEYHLSELIGREIVNIYKVQREKLSGQIINSTNYTALPSFGKTFAANNKLYALNYGSLDFANEVMQVELVEVEDYETEDFTFVEAAIDAGGGSNLGSGDTTFIQWSAAGNATRIYSLDTATEAEQGGAYVVIDKVGMASAKKVALLDLLVNAYTKVESDAKYLGITAKAADSELLDNHDSTYFATATGGTGYIQNQIASVQTADYWISGKAKMGTLVLPTSATLASGEVGLYTTESGFSGELPSGAGSVTSVGLSMPTGFSVANSPITESDTLAVTFASGYFLPTTAQFASKLDVSLKGSANGLAELDENGFVKNTQLPSYVDDVIEVANFASLPVTGESGKIYITIDTNLTYRWSGTIYAEISASLALGETSATAYRGDRGKTAYDHSQITSGNPHGTTAADVGAVALSGTALTLNQDLNVLTDLGTWFTSSTAIDASLINRPSTLTGECYVVNKGGVDYFEQEFIEVNGNTKWLRNYRGGVWGAWKLNYNSGNANLSTVNWSAAKLTSTTLILPQTTPSLATGEMAIYGIESGFSGETPSGAGSVTSISMVVPTGLSITPETITESGTFTISYASGYSIPTNTKQGEWDSAYTNRITSLTTTGSGAATLANNVLNIPTYTLPTATGSILGGVKIGSNITITDGVISVAAPYTLPTATGSVLGGVKIGTNVSITDGVISVHNPVTLGTANGLSLSTQVLSLGLASTSTNGALSSTDWNAFNGKQSKLIGTGASSLVRVNASGVVAYDDATYVATNDSRLSDARTPVAHNQDWSTINVASRPTTLSGYGITDASASGHNHSNLYNGNVFGGDCNLLVQDYIMSYTHLVLSSATNLFPVANNANAILTVATHIGSYSHQLGFSSNGNLYSRYFSAGSPSSWKTVLDSGNFSYYADSAGAASAVQGNLNTHINNNGTSVHGLGSASVKSDTDFIQNQNSSAQSANLWISGGGKFDSQVYVNQSNGTSIALILGGEGVNGIRQRYIFGAGSGLYNWQIGSSINAANDFEITPSTVVDGVVFSTPVLKLLGTGAATFASSIAMNGALSGATTGAFSSAVTMLENINTNLRIPRVAPTNATANEYYFYIVE